MKKIKIIAEAGVNHNGSLKNALKLIKIAAKAGADIVKFQVVDASVIQKKTKMANYQKKNTGNNETQYEMIKKLELDWNKVHPKLINECKKNKIGFLTTAFSNEALIDLKRIGTNIFKVPSGEITNMPYLKLLGSFKKKILLSTGMANLSEIKTALKILFKAGTCKKKITLLHCNTAYPTPYEDANIKAIETLKKRFNIKVGYSDHTLGNEASIAAVTLGSEVIEKHFTINKLMKGPDHIASLNPKELKFFIRSIRNTEKLLGSGKKVASKSEKENINVARKSILSKIKINKGDIFTKYNLCVKRPGTGISPMLWYKILGKKSKKKYNFDELISKVELKND
jgi:N,N'-diacetyllegionaminate synthase